LSCAGNQLTELDVCNKTELVELNCSYNQLTTLNVSGASNLYMLQCSNNQITKLEMSNNITLCELYCSNNQLTELDVSGSNSGRFWRLSVSNNQLTASALNNLFRALYNYSASLLKGYPGPPTFAFWISISNNPGTDDCDISIAVEKGWIVYK